jgi:osmotically inducible protein OsmC
MISAAPLARDGGVRGCMTTLASPVPQAPFRQTGPVERLDRPDPPLCKTLDMAKALYTATATVTGGRVAGHAVTGDGRLDLQLRLPTELGGDGEGTNPEQLFAIGYAACFEGALDVAGRREQADVADASIDSRVSLLPTGDGGFKLAVELAVELPHVTDGELARRLVAAAHEICPYSNATRGNIEVTLSANGEPVR